MQLAKDLTRSITELGPLPATRTLLADLGTLSAYCEERGVDVDVVVAASPTPEAAKSIAAWLTPSLEPSALIEAGANGSGAVSVPLADGQSVVRIAGAATAPIQKVAAPRPAVLVTVLGSAAPLERDRQEELGDLMEDRALVILMSALPDESRATLQPLALQRQVPMVESPDPASLPANGWPLRLESAPPPGIAATLRGYAALYGIDTAAKAVKLVLEQEQRSLKVKRALVQQESAKLQQPAANPMELITETRTRLQRTFGEFERTAQEGLRTLFLPQVGTLSNAVEQFLLKLGSFEEKKGEKTIALRLADKVEVDFFALIRETARSHAMGAVARLAALFDAADAEGNASLAAVDAPPLSVERAAISEVRLTRMLDSAMRIDRPYRGEFPNHGIQEYIQQAKKYLSIFVAILGAAGVSMTKFLPPQAVLGISLALIGAGLATLPSRIRRERAENLSRELERARDIMRGEARRMFSEIEREWLAMVGEALRDEQTYFMQQFEAAVREGQARRTIEVADDRRRLQRQLSGMDNSDRLLTAAKRTRDAVETSAAQLRTTLRQQLMAASATARRPA